MLLDVEPELAAEIRKLNCEVQLLETELANPLWTLVFDLHLGVAASTDLRRSV